MVQAAIETMLRQKIGLDANSIGSRTIARAVDARRLACALPDQASYLHRLQTSAQELEELIESVVVPETWFFRDKEPFIYLSQYVKTEWLKANTTILRVLSVPCSTGEEPLSIAMTLLDSGLTAHQFCIDAVDISKCALLKAQQGIYSKRSFRGGDGLSAQGRYFQEVAGGYQVRPFVRERVKFMHGNLLKPDFLSQSKYQIIFCRNLLIYLDYAARTQALQALDRALALGGLLFLGAAETAQITAKHFTPIRHRFAFAYRKANPAPVSDVKPKTITGAAKVNAPDTKPPPLPQFAQPVRTQPLSKLEIAKQLADRGQLAEAVANCESYLSVNRTDAPAYILLGEIYQALNRLDVAEQSFQKAIYLNPHSIEALIHLALLKEQRGDRARSEILRQRVQRLLKIQK